MKIAVQLEPGSPESPAEVAYKWDPDTEILSAQLSPASGGEGMSGSVGLEGSDGSWLILDVNAGSHQRRRDRRVARRPEAARAVAAVARSRTSTSSFRRAARSRTSRRWRWRTHLIAEADQAQRNFHFRLGKPKLTRTIRLARDVLLDVDDKSQISGLWLLNVPPGSRRAVITTIVLIRVDPTLIPTAANMLAGVDGVTEVYSVSGDWDLVAIVRVPQYDQIARVVTEIFPTVPGIQRTQTLTAFRAYSKKDLQQAWDIGVE